LLSSWGRFDKGERLKIASVCVSLDRVVIGFEAKMFTALSEPCCLHRDRKSISYLR